MARERDTGLTRLEARLVESFGDEWRRFDQSGLATVERDTIFADYFRIFPWHRLPAGGGTGADVGCGSGRWAAVVAPRVAQLLLIDPSDTALAVARGNLRGVGNVSFERASVDALPLRAGSLDFAYALGVLHHVRDTAGAVRAIAATLKPGAPFLIYLYYAFDNRPFWYQWLWRLADTARRAIARLPHGSRYLVTQVIAATCYWPLARLARVLERRGMLPANWPLAYYRDKSFYVMRNDARDRFGTALERRFTQRQIAVMLASAGFEEITFADGPPYWCATGVKSGRGPR
jgi:ubiquinone/menaquinone biosynthesis C-methylase UbiE